MFIFSSRYLLYFIKTKIVHIICVHMSLKKLNFSVSISLKIREAGTMGNNYEGA